MFIKIIIMPLGKCKLETARSFGCVIRENFIMPGNELVIYRLIVYRKEKMAGIVPGLR
jgi:hypothetical protein